MTYQQWAGEYLESAKNVKAQIERVKEKIKTAKYDKLPELNNSLNILTEMYYDCMDTARLLGRRTREC